MVGGMHGRGIYMAGGVCGGGCAWQHGRGACIVGGMCGMHAPHTMRCGQ